MSATEVQPDGDAGEEARIGQSLSDEERMLITLRDTLYEGSWEDFAHDLRERMAGRPYVFDIHPISPRRQDTIRRHLGLIEEMMRREY